jgi:O-antigen/teichoic acid export membrane protein
VPDDFPAAAEVPPEVPHGRKSYPDVVQGGEPSASARLGIHRLREATAWRYGYLVAQGGLSFLLYVVLGRILPAATFAACSTALGVVVITQAAGDFGFSQAALAVLPNAGTLKRSFRRSDLESGAALTFLLAAVAAVALSLLAALVVPGPAALPVIAVAPAAGIAVAVAGTDGILRAEGEFRRPVLFVAASRLGAFASVPVAASSGSSTATCVAVSSGTLICSVPALRLLVARLHAGTPRGAAKAFAAAAAPLGVSNAAIIASARFNTIILGGVASLHAAAVFESAWRLFQVGQYALGGAPTAASPFIANAISEHRMSELRAALRRASGLIVLGGAVFGGVLVLAREPVCRVLFATLGPSVARSLLWLAPALPLNLMVLLMSITLAAVSSADRRWVAIAYLVGAVFNAVVLLSLAGRHPDIAGGAAAATGILATTLVLAARMRTAFMSLDSAIGRPPAAVAGPEGHR